MIQEFKDEVLDTNLQPDVEPRYTIRDNAGNVLNDNVKIELKTPVIENGTPLNKATMGNIQGDLYTVDRYTKTVVTDGIEYRMMPTTGNIFPTEWEDVSTGTKDIFKANGITISAPKTNVTNSGGERATLDNAFDNFVGSSSGQGYKYSTPTSPVEILINFDTPTKITKTKISFGTRSTTVSLISNIYIKGSKNNSEWVTLASYTGSQTSTFTYINSTLVNADYYSTYKIEYVCTANSEDTTMLSLEEFQTTEYYSLQPTTVYTHNLSLPLTSYEIGKIVNIEGNKFEIYHDDEEQTNNIFPTSGWTVNSNETAMTHSEGYKVVVDYSTANSPIYMFDNDKNTKWIIGATSKSNITLTCPFPVKITKMKTYITWENDSDTYWGSVKIQGSKNNEDWVDLYEISTMQTELTEITLSNSDYYTYYRIANAHNHGSYESYIYEWQVSGWILPTHIEEITSFENPYLNINNLGAKLINGKIEAGQQYNLVYNGQSFDIIISGGKMGLISELPVTITQNALGNYTTIDATYKYDLGFTPSSVWAFEFDNINLGSTGVRYHYVPSFEQYRDSDDDTYERFYRMGGFATQNKPIDSEYNTWVLRIVEGGFEYHEYEYDYEKDSTHEWVCHFTLPTHFIALR